MFSAKLVVYASGAVMMIGPTETTAIGSAFFVSASLTSLSTDRFKYTVRLNANGPRLQQIIHFSLTLSVA